MKNEAKPLAEAEILKVMTKATKSAAAAILVSWLVSEAAWSEWACQVAVVCGNDYTETQALLVKWVEIIQKCLQCFFVSAW